MMKKRGLATALILILAGAATAQTPAAPQATDQVTEPVDPRTAAARVTPLPRCADVKPGEIVICGSTGENSEFRIPKALRQSGKAAPNEALARARNMDDISREGMPGSDSASGTFGQSGQRQRMLREWDDECPKRGSKRTCNRER